MEDVLADIVAGQNGVTIVSGDFNEAVIRCEETDSIFGNVYFMTEADLIQQPRALFYRSLERCLHTATLPSRFAQRH